MKMKKMITIMRRFGRSKLLRHSFETSECTLTQTIYDIEVRQICLCMKCSSCPPPRHNEFGCNVRSITRSSLACAWNAARECDNSRFRCGPSREEIPCETCETCGDDEVSGQAEREQQPVTRSTVTSGSRRCRRLLAGIATASASTDRTTSSPGVEAGGQLWCAISKEVDMWIRSG